MSAGELLGRLVARLDAAGIPHMVTGSFASTFHGVARTTHDVDLVIDPERAALERFVVGLPVDEYYADRDVALDALVRRSQFNVIDVRSAWKVDLIIRKERPFSREEFARRRSVRLLGADVFVATAEDSILSKLEWAAQGDSERQLRDVAGIVAVRGASLDLAYVERWVATLGLADVWRRARDPETPR